MLDAAGAFAGYRGIGWNVSALREAAHRVAHLAAHAPLTGLPARDSCAALAAAERTLNLVRDLAPLGDVALRDPAGALAAAERYYVEKKAAVDGILDRMLNDPGSVQ